MRIIGESQNGRTIELAPGEIAEIVLPETPSTGYRWQIAASVEPACAVAVETSEPPHSAKPGAPGTHRWRVEAKKAGACEFKVAYRRPWEASSNAAREFSIRIRVAPQ